MPFSTKQQYENLNLLFIILLLLLLLILLFIVVLLLLLLLLNINNILDHTIDIDAYS